MQGCPGGLEGPACVHRAAWWCREGRRGPLQLVVATTPPRWYVATVGHREHPVASQPHLQGSLSGAGWGTEPCGDAVLNPRGFPFEQGVPMLLRASDCDFVFGWETPLVCPDEVRVDGCSLMDEQLHYSFNLSSLSKIPFKVMPLTHRLAVLGMGRTGLFLIVTCVLGNRTPVTTEAQCVGWGGNGLGPHLDAQD